MFQIKFKILNLGNPGENYCSYCVSILKDEPDNITNIMFICPRNKFSFSFNDEYTLFKRETEYRNIFDGILVYPISYTGKILIKNRVFSSFTNGNYNKTVQYGKETNQWEDYYGKDPEVWYTGKIVNIYISPNSEYWFSDRKQILTKRTKDGSTKEIICGLNLGNYYPLEKCICNKERMIKINLGGLKNGKYVYEIEVIPVAGNKMTLYSFDKKKGWKKGWSRIVKNKEKEF